MQECPSIALVGSLGALVCLENSDSFLDLTTQHKGEKVSRSSVKLHQELNISGPNVASTQTCFQKVKDLNNYKIQACCFCRRLISPKTFSVSYQGKFWGISPLLSSQNLVNRSHISQGKLPDTTLQSPGSSKKKQQWKGESGSCLQGATKRCSQFTPTTLMGTKAKYSPELRRKLKKYHREAAVCLVSILREKHLPGCFHVEVPPCFSPLASQPPPKHPQAWPVLSRSCFQLLL